MGLLDINKVEQEAQKELNEELANKAKTQIKAKLKEIENAKKILRNLEVEYQDLLAEITGN